MELQKSDFDLGSLVQGLESMFRVRCQEKGLQLTVEGFEGPVPVHGDEGKLRQILINLIGNAVKFTKEGEVKLVVSRGSQRKEAPSSPQDADPPLVTSTATDRYLFEISDTGNGISPEGIAQLFQPFQQGEEGMKQGGTGLGLAISKRQLDLMNSELQVESEPGKGSRFSFQVELPAAQGTLTSQTPAESRRVIGLKHGFSVRALVVDDVAENRAVLSQLLRGIGCDVEVADSGEAAIQAVRRRSRRCAGSCRTLSSWTFACRAWTARRHCVRSANSSWPGNP